MTVPHKHIATGADGELESAPCTDPRCPMGRLCDCGPGELCVECATDEELAAAIPPWPAL